MTALRAAGPLVVKFGGASLADPGRVVRAVTEARRSGVRVVVVVSARERVTDLLVAAVRTPRDRAAHRRLLAEVTALHPGLPPTGRRHLERLRGLLRAVERSRAPDPPLVDRVLSQGERLAAHWIAGALRSSGVPATAVEADHLGLITDNAYGASCILLDRSRAPVRRGLARLLARGEVPVVTGFFGRSLEGRVATLGRGGSDYSAAALAALVGARRLELVKRHVAVLSADPADVPEAQPIPALSYEEAEELAQFGARVLHPLTIEPARAHGVPIVVRSLDDPAVSTAIGPSRRGRRNRAFTMLRPLRLLRLRVPGGRQRPGIVSEVAERLRKAGVNVVQLFTSSALLCLILEPRSVAGALRALAPITGEDGVTVDGPTAVALVTVIGDGVLGDLHRLPRAAVAGVEGFSATPRALSLAVADRQGRQVVRALHAALVRVRG